MDLSQLGFVSRHHAPELTPEEHIELEVEVGARFLREAAAANGWKPEEVEGVMIGMTLPSLMITPNASPVRPAFQTALSRLASIRPVMAQWGLCTCS